MAIKKSDDSMCKTWPSNSGYTFLIAIKDYNFQNDGEDFLNSGAGISITNGLQTVEHEMEASTDDHFTFTPATAGTFFDGGANDQ